MCPISAADLIMSDGFINCVNVKVFLVYISTLLVYEPIQDEEELNHKTVFEDDSDQEAREDESDLEV